MLYSGEAKGIDINIIICINILGKEYTGNDKVPFYNSRKCNRNCYIYSRYIGNNGYNCQYYRYYRGNFGIQLY